MNVLTVFAVGAFALGTIAIGMGLLGFLGEDLGTFESWLSVGFLLLGICLLTAMAAMAS